MRAMIFLSGDFDLYGRVNVSLVSLVNYIKLAVLFSVAELPYLSHPLHQTI